MNTEQVDVMIVPVQHPRLHIRRCSCGFVISAVRSAEMVEGVTSHLHAVHGPMLRVIVEGKS